MISTEVLKEGNVFLGRSQKNILSISAVSGLLANHCLLSARASLSAGLLFYIWLRKVFLRCEAGRGGEKGEHSTEPPPQLPLPIPHTPQPGFTGPVNCLVNYGITRKTVDKVIFNSRLQMTNYKYKCFMRKKKKKNLEGGGQQINESFRLIAKTKLRLTRREL